MHEILKNLADDKTMTLIYLAVLLLEGFIIKHSSLFKKVSNNAIPFILMITSVIICVIGSQSLSLPVIVEAIIGSLIATGLHQAGKITFKTFMPEFVLNLRSSLGVAEIGNTDKLAENNENIENIIKHVETLEQNMEDIYTFISAITGEENSEEE
jgi:hypothetical protein